MRIYFQKVRVFGVSLLFLLFSISLLGQIGINTTAPKTALDVNGAFSIRNGGVLGIQSANTDYLDPSVIGDTAYSTYLVGYSTDFSISGVKPVDGADGQFLVLVNPTNKMMTLKHRSCSIPENGFWIQGEKDLNLTGKYSNVFLLYSKNIEDGRGGWVVINKNNHIEVWESKPINLNGRIGEVDGITICKVYVPQATSQSSASVNIRGNIDENLSKNLYIEYVETRIDTVAFRIRNTGEEQEDKQFNVVINKI